MATTAKIAIWFLAMASAEAFHTSGRDANGMSGTSEDAAESAPPKLSSNDQDDVRGGSPDDQLLGKRWSPDQDLGGLDDVYGRSRLFGDEGDEAKVLDYSGEIRAHGDNYTEVARIFETLRGENDASQELTLFNILNDGAEGDETTDFEGPIVDDPYFWAVGQEVVKKELGRNGSAWSDMARHYMATILGHLRDLNSADTLLTALNNGDLLCREAAAKALVDLRSHSEVKVHGLARALQVIQHGRVLFARALANSHGAVSDETDETLLAIFTELQKDKDKDVKGVAKEFLSIQVAADPDKPVDVRRAALWALGAIGADAAATVLGKVAADPDNQAYVREAAIQALAVLAMGGKAPQAAKATEPLAAVLWDPKACANTQVLAAWALGKIGSDAAEAALGKAAADHGKHKFVRKAALRALGAIGSDAALAAVRGVAADPKAPPIVRTVALVVWGKGGSMQEATRALEEMLADKKLDFWPNEDEMLGALKELKRFSAAGK